MVTDGQDRFWVMWMGVSSVSNYLYLARSEDGGKTWSDPISVGGNIRSVYGHALQLVGNRLFVMWLAGTDQGDRVWTASSADGGATWTPPTHVQHLPADRNIQVASPAMLVTPDGEALVAWNDTRNGRFDIYLSRSTDHGRTWGSEDVRLDTDDAGTAHSRYPRFARAADGRVIIAWEDDREGWEGIYARVRTGTTWGPETRVVGPGTKKGVRLPQPLWVGANDVQFSWEMWDYSGGAMRISRQVEQRTLKLEGRAGR
jgi:Neuraminidase (sialidase)